MGDFGCACFEEDVDLRFWGTRIFCFTRRNRSKRADRESLMLSIYWLKPGCSWHDKEGIPSREVVEQDIAVQAVLNEFSQPR